MYMFWSTNITAVVTLGSTHNGSFQLERCINQPFNPAVWRL